MSDNNPQIWACDNLLDLSIPQFKAAAAAAMLIPNVKSQSFSALKPPNLYMAKLLSDIHWCPGRGQLTLQWRSSFYCFRCVLLAAIVC